jgi:dTMP kinase
MKGKFITLEGGDGVGKSTQAALLAQKLSKFEVKVKITREPGGTELGEKIRNILRSFHKIDAVCETLLLFAARRAHFVHLISPLLDEGYFVICDRFYDSSLVYQGILKNVSFEDIIELKEIVLGNFEPDLTIVLDMEAKISQQRLKVRNLIPDEYDVMDMEKHEQVRRGFQKIVEIFSFRSVLVNAGGTEEKVAARIFKIINERFVFA